MNKKIKLDNLSDTEKAIVERILNNTKELSSKFNGKVTMRELRSNHQEISVFIYNQKELFNMIKDS